MYSSRMHTARSSSRLLGGVSASVHTGIPPGCDLPQAWAWRPPPPGQTPQLSPGCWPGDPPRPDPLTYLLSVGLGDLQGMLGYALAHLQSMLAYHLQGMMGYHPLPTPPPPHCGQTDSSKNITFVNFVCDPLHFTPYNQFRHGP